MRTGAGLELSAHLRPSLCSDLHFSLHSFDSKPVASVVLIPYELVVHFITELDRKICTCPRLLILITGLAMRRLVLNKKSI